MQTRNGAWPGGRPTRRELVWSGVPALALAGCANRPSGRARRADTLTIAVPADPAGLEPGTNQAEPIGSEIILNVFDTLVAWNQASPAIITPRLAQAWTVSPDGRRFVFTMRPGIAFHDGTPCDAPAAAFSLRRSIALNSYLRASLDAVSTISAPDAATLVIDLARPVPFFLSLVAQPQAAIVSPDAVRRLGPGFARRPIGTGPFRIHSYEPDVSVVLEANPRYFRGPPAIARLVYVVVGDASTRRMMLEAGDIDIAHQSGQLASLPMEDLAAFRRNPAIRVITAPSRILRQLEFNNLLTTGPTTDIRVRQAMAHAVDYDGLVSGVLAGTVDRAYGPLPTSDRAFDPARRAAAPRHDPARARQLLREAGHPPGTLRYALYTFQGSFWSTVATFLQANMAAVGIGLDIRQLEFPSLRATHVAGQFAVALDGRSAWYDDPDAHLTIGYLSSLATSAMTFRMPRDAALDAALLRAQSCLDPVERTALYHGLQADIAARVPAIYLFSNRIIVFARREVTGLHVGGTPPLTEYWRVGKAA